MTDLGKTLKKKRPAFSQELQPVIKGSIVIENDLNSFIGDLRFKESYTSLKPQNVFVSFPLLPQPHKDSTNIREEEERAFFSWKKTIIEFETSSGSSLSPFEKNLEIWRQFHLLVRCCNVVVQVVDGRNPLFYWNSEVHEYLLGLGKASVILLNKSDFLTPEQQQTWVEYFSKLNVPAVIFSCLNPSELIDDIKKILARPDHGEKIGFLGFPNVGKSSVVNCLTSSKYHCAASSTPGKTKHVQTFLIGADTIFDCPGFVFPKVATKDDLIINNVLPLSALTDVVSPLRKFFSSFPIENVYELYHIPFDGESISYEYGVDRKDTTMILLFTLSKYKRYFTSNHGVPDYTKSARLLLKDVIEGRLLLCFPPETAPLKVLEFNNFQRTSATPQHHIPSTFRL